MPHDKNGKAIKVGDFVKATPANYSNHPVIGRVTQMHESQACSGRFSWAGIGEQLTDYFDAESAELVLKADGSEPSEGEPPCDA